MSNFNNVVIDLETYAKGGNSAIVSIGAVEFNIETGEIGRCFEMNIDLQSSIDLGLRVDASTVNWWMEQSDEARKGILKDPKNLVYVLDKLSSWFGKIEGDWLIWGNGPSFDQSILKDSYRVAGIDLPWNFRNERCVRTLVGLYPTIKEEVVAAHKNSNWHTPLNDCLVEAEYISKTWNML